MKELIVKISNEQGLHARPSGEIVKIVRKYDSYLKIIKGDMEADGKSIMELMALGAGKGEKLILRANGENEDMLLRELQELIEINKFFED